MPDFLRQLDILNPHEVLFPITVIGAGGIGSVAALTLAKMGCKEMTLYDPGRVEPHNRPNQWFRKKDEVDKNDPEERGRFKVEALKEIIGEFAEWCNVQVFAESFHGQRPVKGVVVCAVDHMGVDEADAWGRKEIWQKVRRNIEIPLYIDGRLGGEIIQVFTVRPSNLEDIEWYEDTLFNDKDAQPLACTEQAIIYTGLEVAARIAIQLKKWLKQEPYPPIFTYVLKADQLLLG